MRKYIPQYLVILISLLVILPQYANAYEKEKLINKSFAVDSNDKVSVKNMFGSVQFINGNSNQVQIEIRVYARGSDKSKVDKFVETVDFEISKDGSLLKAYTLSPSNSNKGSKGLKEFKIDYKITLPDYLELKVKHSFGSLELVNHRKVDIDLSYGSITHVGEIKEESNIEISFGSAELDKIFSAEVESNMSHVKVNEATKLNIDNKYGDSVLKMIKEELRANVAHSEFKLATGKAIKFFDLQASFSDINIDLSELENINIDYRGVNSNLDLSSVFKILEKESKFMDEVIKAQKGSKKLDIKLKAKFSDLNVK